jgi:RNA polymerase sigma factor (sigma-70 family)
MGTPRVECARVRALDQPDRTADCVGKGESEARDRLSAGRADDAPPAGGLGRARGNLKRGGHFRKVSLEEASAVVADSHMDFAALDDALQKLETLHPRKVQVVELRYFGGLSLEESAAVLRVSTDTVKRDWRFAKAWLSRELSGAQDS